MVTPKFHNKPLSRNAALVVIIRRAVSMRSKSPKPCQTTCLQLWEVILQGEQKAYILQGTLPP